MRNFEFYNPTKLVFGKGQIRQLAKLVPAGAKVMLLYGGGSIMKNGIYDQVKQALAGFEVAEFGGIEANPEYQTLLRALEAIRAERADFLLAVGGGSVIDGTKFLAAAALYEGGEPWDILEKRLRTDKAMPFGSVLTLPATGSEMNSGAVVSRSETQQKLGMGGPGLFPQFSICDPEAVRSLPPRQIANGIADAFVHVLEQYATYPAGAALQDRIAEGVMLTLAEVAPKVMADPADYEAAANFMWCCTMALNGLLQKGVPVDWSVHAIAHELTARYGIDHARTLAVILPSAYHHRFEQKKAKLAQYGQRVWGLNTGSPDEDARQAIRKTADFFQSLGIATRLRDYTADYAGFPEWVAGNLQARGWVGIGEHGDVHPEMVRSIVEASC
jgi:NADP-dependent alcohol dehydrogenase